ncbi:(2E,6E)-farnesyl diphosphate synthase [Immundisolibacter sp.]|uniref:(2E,6E)-farnesyl diphosphate synthase n=1 Tax=Immundisolibacter sp. TaxID=1934948 RepID=UPI00260F7946|nr:farnesyl diphosphate synthase [Immundisolibacter sp.]MDD3650495.1 (2E,6E)-farnesyl diphosphate synthase [Immundisolibacter sp.]
MQSLDDFLAAVRARSEAVLDRLLPPADLPVARLAEAMRYAALGGGKRLRAALVYAGGEALGADPAALDAPAAAVELIHAYSLVHDDLPAMDDDDLRRGKPTCHRAFDEATAILAGDALQTLAFEVLAAAEAIAPERRLAMLRELARASGVHGMAGGQALDLAAEGKRLTLPELETVHRGKTGALIVASVRLGALVAPAADAPLLAALAAYGQALGLCFQIQDDILDIDGDTATLGKTAGADSARGKATYPALLGIDGARERARQECERAVAALAPLGAAAGRLAQLAAYSLSRRA